MSRIILVLGDQLSRNISSLRNGDKSSDIVLMCEALDETRYVNHHKKKIAFVFSAMRHFAEDLRRDGWRIDYHRFDSKSERIGLTDFLGPAQKRYGVSNIVVTEPSEWRVLRMLELWSEKRNARLRVIADDRFICSKKDFSQWADGRKQLRMEQFYRVMRRREGILMEGGNPVGGKWNFDAENRKSLSSDADVSEPFEKQADEITSNVIDLVAREFSDHFGDLQPFRLAVTWQDAEKALDYFLDRLLPSFGDYQDAMLVDYLSLPKTLSVRG